MEIADARLYADGMRQQIKRFATLTIQLEIVDDVRQWCLENETAGCIGNPVGIAIGCTGGYLDGLILVRQKIDASLVRGVTSRIMIPSAQSLLATPQAWLDFLVLHELAHLENKWGQEREDDCDSWAMERFLAGRKQND